MKLPKTMTSGRSVATESSRTRGAVFETHELELRECIADVQLVRPAEACDGRDDDTAFVARERLRVLEVSRIEVGLRGVAFGHRAGLWR